MSERSHEKSRERTSEYCVVEEKGFLIRLQRIREYHISTPSPFGSWATGTIAYTLAAGLATEFARLAAREPPGVPLGVTLVSPKKRWDCE